MASSLTKLWENVSLHVGAIFSHFPSSPENLLLRLASSFPQLLPLPSLSGGRTTPLPHWWLLSSGQAWLAPGVGVGQCHMHCMTWPGTLSAQGRAAAAVCQVQGELPRWGECPLPDSSSSFRVWSLCSLLTQQTFPILL